MIDDSVLGEDQGTFTINGQTYVSPDKVDRLMAVRQEPQNAKESKPFYRNAFFWGTIFSWMFIFTGAFYYCQHSGSQLKQNLLMDDLRSQSQQV